MRIYKKIKNGLKKHSERSFHCPGSESYRYSDLNRTILLRKYANNVLSKIGI